MNNVLKCCVIGTILSIIVFPPIPVYGYDLIIEEIEITMIVGEDNVIDIEENINVKFNRTDMHGIFRDIPLETYFKKPVTITDIQVENYPFIQEKVDGQLRLKIGDPYVYADSRENYNITYSYQIGDDRNPEMDELYFNIVGLSWEIPINRTTFKIVMPKTFDKEDVSLTYGYSGSTNSEELEYTIVGEVIAGTLNRVLYPGEGLTIALPLPEGYYSDIAIEQDVIDYLSPILPFIVIGFFTIGLILWFNYGKPKQRIPTVEFYPPKDLTPMEVGYAVDQQLDPYDFTAMLIYWADLGYIRFHESEQQKGKLFKKTERIIQIEKLSYLPPNISEYESTFFNDLFNKYGHDNRVQTTSLANSFYITLDKVKKGLIEFYTKDDSQKLITDVSRKTAKALGVMGFILMVIINISIFHVINPYQIALGSIFAFILAIISTALTISGSQKISLFSSRMFREKLRYLAVGIILIVVSFGINSTMALYIGEELKYLIMVALSQVLLILVPYSKRLTINGELLMNHLMGFKSFIENAEKDRINTLVEADPEYFYHILPFAMALGVTDKWARQFESITLQPPNWYNSPYLYGSFNAGMFANHINESTKSIRDSMTSTPSSGGGSFGGGSSGGGSGGGGGGGW